jgi:hypothetical protein
MAVYYACSSVTERELLLKSITSGEQVKGIKHLSSPSAQNIIEEMPVFTGLGVKHLNAHTGSPKKNY